MNPASSIPINPQFPSDIANFLIGNAPNKNFGNLTQQAAANLLQQRLPGYRSDSLIKWQLGGFPSTPGGQQAPPGPYANWNQSQGFYNTNSNPFSYLTPNRAYYNT